MDALRREPAGGVARAFGLGADDEGEGRAPVHTVIWLAFTRLGQPDFYLSEELCQFIPSLFGNWQVEMRPHRRAHDFGVVRVPPARREEHSLPPPGARGAEEVPS